MTHCKTRAWVIGATLLAILSITPCFATDVVMGDTSKDTAFLSIQVIEGTEVTSGPPLPPRLYGHVSETQTPDDAASWSPQGVATPYQDIASVVARMNRRLAPGEVNSIAQAIHMSSQRYGMDPRLLACIVAVESSFNPAAISSSGAIGLGQLKPETARWLGVADPFDPVQNLWGMAKYMRYLLDRYNGSVQHALAAYFRGQGTIDRNGLDAGALSYVGKVNTIFTRFF